jgi:uncharacterized protein YjbI with pentapeptide repeats
MANPEHLELLRQGVDGWNAWFKKRSILPGFSGADLSGADLRGTDLRGADLRGADLRKADLSEADLSEADLSGANLSGATLVKTNLVGAVLTGCRIYGVSAWDMKLDGTKQNDLVITPYNEPEVTVDNIEVAQFVYLLLRNEKIRDVIDTIGRKACCCSGGSQMAGLRSSIDFGRNYASVAMCRSSSTSISQRRRTSPRLSDCSPVYQSL